MASAHKLKFIKQNEVNNELTLKPTSSLVKNSLFKHSKTHSHIVDTSNKSINQRQVNPFSFFSINSKLMPTPAINHKKNLENKYAEELRLRHKRELEKHYEEELANRYRPKLRRC